MSADEVDASDVPRGTCSFFHAQEKRKERNERKKSGWLIYTAKTIMMKLIRLETMEPLGIGRSHSLKLLHDRRTLEF